MSKQHPNPKNKVPGRLVGGRSIHNERKTKHSAVCREASRQERRLYAAYDPPNRSGLRAFRAAARKAAAEKAAS